MKYLTEWLEATRYNEILNWLEKHFLSFPEYCIFNVIFITKVIEINLLVNETSISLSINEQL